MLLDRDILAPYLTDSMILHIGMHLAEELPLYKEVGISCVLFVEADERKCIEVSARVKEYEDIVAGIVNTAVSDKKEQVNFNITNNGESSSILALKDHKAIYPHIRVVGQNLMLTHTLDEVIDKVSFEFDTIVADIQGAELKAFRGLSNWDKVKTVITEVNFREMYEGCGLIDEMDNFLLSKGLKRQHLVDTGCGWGDALYSK